MIQITDKIQCCGCTACAERCPRHCIQMKTDAEGFLYPKVDESSCVHCDLCDKVCPMLHVAEARMPISVWAAKNNDGEIVRSSSSGGVFTALAEQVVRNGGVVFGVRFNEQWHAVFDHADTLEGLAPFRGSKYVQASVGNAFAEARDFLKAGRQVLFSGTPCQIAGLNRFLSRKYDNLLTVDFICHGVPSPKVWSRYLDEVTKHARRAIRDVQFRDKSDGWRKFNFVIDYDTTSGHYCLSSWHKHNHYMRIFLGDAALRPSCYGCKAKDGRSGSDLTIADFWGIARWHKEADDDKGTSAVLVHTSKGSKALDDCDVSRWESCREEVLASNPSLVRSVKPHPRRQQFFERLDTAESITQLIDDTLRITPWERIKRFPRQVAVKVYLMLRYENGGGKTSSSDNSLSEEMTRQEPLPPLNDTQTCDHSVAKIDFRSKHSGWKNYHLRIELT